MGSPDMASKKWIWSQYDRHVMADTAASSESPCDAAIVRIHGTDKALAITTDCTPRYCLADPYEGGKQAVAEAWRNLTAAGADPIAITDCLNFGNPERPEIMGQFVGCVEGMAEACRALSFPVVSGNVSLYNETEGRAIPPTPAVGAVGLIPDIAQRAGYGCMEAGDVVLVIGDTAGALGASLYLRLFENREDGAPPPVDLAAEKRNGDFVRGQIRAGRLKAVHDLSDGGLLATLSEGVLRFGVGARVWITELMERDEVDALAALLAESTARVLVSVAREDDVKFRGLCDGRDVPVVRIGVTDGEVDGLEIQDRFTLSHAELSHAHRGTLPARFGSVVGAAAGAAVGTAEGTPADV
jgi:phosphoribosylformylglycinamidine synthase